MRCGLTGTRVSGNTDTWAWYVVSDAKDMHEGVQATRVLCSSMPETVKNTLFDKFASLGAGP